VRIPESGIVSGVVAESGLGADEEPIRNRWTFLTNHAHVLVWISNNPQSRVRDIAASVRITERAAQSILKDLEQDGYVTKERVGRRNTYTVHPELPLRHPLEAHHAVGELLRVFRT
jgi:DNA-binding transcriptional ArsR family regulator